MTRITQRAQRIEPFYVMEMAKAASELAQQVAHSAKPMLFLNIGEPDFTAPPLVQEAAYQAIAQGRTQYTPATGLPALRERISHWYKQRFGLEVSADHSSASTSTDNGSLFHCTPQVSAAKSSKWANTASAQADQRFGAGGGANSRRCGRAFM